MTIDPSLFRPEAVDAETAAFNAELEAQLSTQTSPHLQDVRAVREARRSGQSGPAPVFLDSARPRAIDGPAGPLTLRCFIPPRIDGVYLHVHGGGWALGGADMQDPRLGAFATNCNLAVVSVDYRLAPEDPYPAGPDDCEAAALWLAKNARAEYGTDALVIGGESAGAHLAALTLLRLRDRHGLQPFAGANLVFGVYDVGGTPSVHRWGERYLVLSAPVMRWFADMFVPPERAREPDVSPLYANLTGLPPALFSVGTMDPLVDDSLFMYARWRGAGSEAELAVFPGGTHGFTGQPTALGARGVATQEEFLRGVTAAKPVGA